MTNLRFDDEYLIKLLTDMVNIPSVFPEEEALMLFLGGELERLGFKPQRIPVTEKRFNLLASIGSGDTTLCFNSHSDTVPPSGRSVPRAVIKDDVMYGLGSADDKAPLAAMIEAFRAIAESRVELNGRLDLLISVDEEGDGLGVRTAIEKGYKCDMAIVGEPSSLGIVPVHCGVSFLDITTHGRSTHGSIPFKGVNAVDMMYELITGLRAAVTDCEAHPLVGPPTLNLGIICGGDRPNRVPDTCQASVDIRIVAPMTFDQIMKKVDAYFAQWEGKAEYTVSKYGDPLNTSLDSTLAKVVRAAGERVRGIETPIEAWRGWTEAESFQTGLGIDAIVLGPGHLVQAHSGDEFVELVQVSQGARIYAESVLSILT